MKPTRVLLVDDHVLVRAGLCALLKSLSGVEVVAEAGDGRDALKLIEALRPDIVIMDVMMSGMSGLEAAARASRQFPNTRIIILSMYANEEYIIQALRAGARGYLLKDAAPVELELALQSVSAGETYLSPAVSKQVVADYLRRVGSDAATLAAASAIELLTPRQREILQLIAEGNTTKQMARKLGLSVKTIETHRSQLMERLDVHDVAGLVRYAIGLGLVLPSK